MNILLKLLLGPMGAFIGGNEEGGQSSQTQREPAKPKAPKGTPVTRIIISMIITLIFAVAYFYFNLPALNLHSQGLYWSIFWMCVVFSVSMIFLRGFRSDMPEEYISYIRKKLPVPFWIAVALIALVIVGSVTGWALFRAYDYSELLTIEEGDFSSEVAETSWSQIPLLDEDSANNLANRKLGELSDLVSQFTVSSSTQINYNSAPVRVNYLNYGGFFKWWNNKSEGIPAYMRIDMRTQEVSVVRLDEGIKYSPSEYFGRDLTRHLRFEYPTLMFGDTTFEIDDSGTPYWVASVIEKKIGLFSGTDISGAILVNAVTGETVYYDIGDVPSWVDRVYSADLLVSQYNYYGKYHNGFWNSIFGQSDCTTTTSGYNFIAQDDDVWMYTGITSVTGDRGNIGFILVNQRTKETRYYPCAGAEEYSAMSSAQGAVQQYSYTASFPLLLNISNQPTYFMALKDSAGLVKMYAMVNVQQYQVVSTGYSLSECQQSYRELLLKNDIIQENEETVAQPGPMIELESASGTITEIRFANIDGNTIFYLKLDGSQVYHTVSAKDYPIAAVLNVGDQVTVTYTPSEESLISVKALTIN